MYLGDNTTANDLDFLKKHKINAVLTVDANTNLDYKNSSVIDYYLVIPAVDDKTFNLGEFFPKTSEWIQEHLYKTNVLVHCETGVSSSAAVVIAFLMKKCKWTVNHAMNYIKGNG